MTTNDMQSTIFVESAKKHDEMVVTFNQATNTWFGEIKQFLDTTFKIPGRLGSKTIFNTRLANESGTNALIIKSQLTDKPHLIGNAHLNLQTSGLVYHPKDGHLCGSIDIIISDGDYWHKIKTSKINPLFGIAVGLANQQALADLQQRRDQKIASIEDISRQNTGTILFDPLYQPYWFVLHDSEASPIYTQEFISQIIDRIFNPEGKDWVYKV